MSGFKQYVCWNDEAVLDATPRDAASLGVGHFQAVHHPLRLRRRRLSTRSEGSWVEESEIVRVLSGPLRPDGYLLLPVVGGSGTGKSHLVRWAHEQTQHNPDWEVRYLAKNRTSIRRVIDIVITGLAGPAIDAAREVLETAPGHTENEEVLAERLLDELALITSEGTGHRQAPVNRTDQLNQKLRNELPDILRDPVVRRRMTAEGAVIPRLVGLAMRGRHDDDGLDDDAIHVLEDDLPLTFEEIGDVSKVAQTLLTQLAGVSELKSAAINLINDALPVAVKRVFVSSKVDLIEVFREVRKALLAAEKELVLFIEDLTVLHGVEREFLDAIVEPATSPDGELCNLRILFAVTESHFDDLDTVRTRCEDAYWLDTSYGSEGVDEGEAISFLGRYLNACRQSPSQRIEDEWRDRENEHWISNACDTCDKRIDCHETFGVSNEGFGLYPFNRPAINTFVSALSAKRFDPREIVRELVNQFLLTSSKDISRGVFPSDAQFTTFNETSEPVPPITVARLQSQRPADNEQLANILRYWSPDEPGINDAILTAFGFAPLSDIDLLSETGGVSRRPSAKTTKARQGTQTEISKDESSVTSRLPPLWNSIFDELTRWSGNQQSLKVGTTNHLKKLIHKSIRQNLDSSPLPTNLGTDFDVSRFHRERHIFITGSATDQPRNDPIITIEQNEVTAAALQGLILLEQLPDGGYPDSDKFRRSAGQYIERWTRTTITELELPPDTSVLASIEGLLFCALITGSCENAKDPNDFLAAMFAAVNGVEMEQRTQKWQTLLSEAQKTHRRLQPIVETHFGEARGTGGVRAIRADLLLEIIESFTRGWDLKSTDSAIERLMQSALSAVNAEWELLQGRVVGTAPLLHANRTWTEQTTHVLEALEGAHRSGRLHDHDALSDLRLLADQTQDNSHHSVLSGAEFTSKELPIHEKIRIVASQLPLKLRS